MAFDNRQTRRLLERMGVNLEQIADVEEVIIRTVNKDIVVKGVSVAEMKGKGMHVFQVTGEDVEEIVREVPKFSEEDILLVSQQAGVSKEKAEQSLMDSDGDLAQAILKLSS